MVLDSQWKASNGLFVSQGNLLTDSISHKRKYQQNLSCHISEPRVYNGYIDYVPYDAADDPVTGHRTLPNEPTDRLHRYLSPLNEPLTSDATTNSPWRRIDGPFAHILITSKGSISQDVVASSKSSLSDGYLTLQFIRSDGSTRMNLAKTFTKLGDGTHFDYGFVQWMPVRAFRLVPNNADGNIMVDGEKVPYGKTSRLATLARERPSLQVPSKVKLYQVLLDAWANSQRPIPSTPPSNSLAHPQPLRYFVQSVIRLTRANRKIKHLAVFLFRLVFVFFCPTYLLPFAYDMNMYIETHFSMQSIAIYLSLFTELSFEY